MEHATGKARINRALRLMNSISLCRVPSASDTFRANARSLAVGATGLNVYARSYNTAQYSGSGGAGRTSRHQITAHAYAVHSQRRLRVNRSLSRALVHGASKKKR